MNTGYKYPIANCDIPTERRAALEAYRDFRSVCLESMAGESATSVRTQVLDLTWNTLVFRTLNEARRLESERTVSGVMWELITDGYANLMTLGIRKLVDRDERTDSVVSVLNRIERFPHPITREQYVCHDGLPFDWEAVRDREFDGIRGPLGRRGVFVGSSPTIGPEAWSMSQRMHEQFDKLTGNPGRRDRADILQRSIVSVLRDRLSNPCIHRIVTMVDKRVAHSERVASAAAVPVATYKDIDDALRTIVRVANFMTSMFFFQHAFGAVVAHPQFDVLSGLNMPWAGRDTFQALRQHWDDNAKAMRDWAYDVDRGFLPQASEA